MRFVSPRHVISVLAAASIPNEKITHISPDAIAGECGASDSEIRDLLSTMRSCNIDVHGATFLNSPVWMECTMRLRKALSAAMKELEAS
jgi:hypothetical protein